MKRDKLLHFIVGVGIAGIASAFAKPYEDLMFTFTAGVVTAYVAGTLKELIDKEPDVFDLVATVAGGIIGGLIVTLV